MNDNIAQKIYKVDSKSEWEDDDGNIFEYLDDEGGDNELKARAKTL